MSIDGGISGHFSDGKLNLPARDSRPSGSRAELQRDEVSWKLTARTCTLLGSVCESGSITLA